MVQRVDFKDQSLPGMKRLQQQQPSSSSVNPSLPSTSSSSRQDIRGALQLYQANIRRKLQAQLEQLKARYGPLPGGTTPKAVADAIPAVVVQTRLYKGALLLQQHARMQSIGPDSMAMPMGFAQLGDPSLHPPAPHAAAAAAGTDGAGVSAFPATTSSSGREGQFSFGELQQAIAASDIGLLADLLNKAATVVLPQQHDDLEEAALKLYRPLQQLEVQMGQLQHLLAPPQGRALQQLIQQQQEQGKQRGKRWQQQQEQGQGQEEAERFGPPGAQLTTWEVKTLLVEDAFPDIVNAMEHYLQDGCVPLCHPGHVDDTAAAAGGGGGRSNVPAEGRAHNSIASSSSSGSGSWQNCLPLLLIYASTGDGGHLPWIAAPQPGAPAVAAAAAAAAAGPSGCSSGAAAAGAGGGSGAMHQPSMSTTTGVDVQKVLDALEKALTAALGKGEDTTGGRVRKRAKELGCGRGPLNPAMREQLQQDCKDLCRVLKQEGDWRSSSNAYSFSSRSSGSSASLLAPLVLDVAVDPQVAEAVTQLQLLVLQMLQQMLWKQWGWVCDSYTREMTALGVDVVRIREVWSVGDAVVRYCCSGVLPCCYGRWWREERVKLVPQLQLGIANVIAAAFQEVLAGDAGAEQQAAGTGGAERLTAAGLIPKVLDKLAVKQQLLPGSLSAGVASAAAAAEVFGEATVTASGGGPGLYTVVLREVLKAANTVLLPKGVLRPGKGGLQLLQKQLVDRKRVPVLSYALSGDLHMLLLWALRKAQEGDQQEQESAAAPFGEITSPMADVLTHLACDTWTCIQDAKEERQRVQEAEAAAATCHTRGTKLQEILSLHAQLTPLLQLYGSVRVVVGDYLLPPSHPSSLQLRPLLRWQWPREAGGPAGVRDVHGRLVPELLQQLSRACRGSPAALGVLAATGAQRNVPQLLMQLLMPLVLSSPEATEKEDGSEGEGRGLAEGEQSSVDEWRWKQQAPLLQGLLQAEVLRALGCEAQGQRYQAALTGEAVQGWEGSRSAFALAQLQEFWVDARPLDLMGLFCTATRCRMAVYVQLPQVKGGHRGAQRQERGRGKGQGTALAAAAAPATDSDSGGGGGGRDGGGGASLGETRPTASKKRKQPQLQPRAIGLQRLQAELLQYHGTSSDAGRSKGDRAAAIDDAPLGPDGGERAHGSSRACNGSGSRKLWSGELCVLPAVKGIRAAGAAPESDGEGSSGVSGQKRGKRVEQQTQQQRGLISGGSTGSKAGKAARVGSLVGAAARAAAGAAGAPAGRGAGAGVGALASGHTDSSLNSSRDAQASPWVLFSPPGVPSDQLAGELLLHVDASRQYRSGPPALLQYTLVSTKRLQQVPRFTQVWAVGNAPLALSSSPPLLQQQNGEGLREARSASKGSARSSRRVATGADAVGDGSGGAATELGRDGYMYNCIGCGGPVTEEELGDAEREPLVCEGRGGCCCVAHRCCLGLAGSPDGGLELGEKWVCCTCQAWLDHARQGLFSEVQGKRQRVKKAALAGV